MKILICALPGSGKTTLAEPLSKYLNAVWINADHVRTKYDDWDFSEEARVIQSNRMLYLSDGAAMSGSDVVTDFVCPTEETRLNFNADFVIWMDTIREGRYDDTNAMFESPRDYDMVITDWFERTSTSIHRIKQMIELKRCL